MESGGEGSSDNDGGCGEWEEHTVISHPHTLFTVGVNPTFRSTSSTGDAPGNGDPPSILVRKGGKKI
jgi:hypothetical protein